jgi:predicted lipid-binding transport protein (Tim44 family)
MGDAGFLDILFFVMVAAFLVLRLRSVLGRRTGQERRPPEEPFARRDGRKPVEGTVVELPDRSRESIDQDHEEPAATVEVVDPIAAGLTEIQIADPSFDPQEFLDGARAAFEMIVHAFATGDTGTLRALLSASVLENFEAAIGNRLQAEETLETTVIGIKRAEIIEAGVDGRTAKVAVSFLSEQVNVTRDADGKVIEGDPNQVTEVTDIWTFAHDLRARDPNWKLVETRSPN